MTQDALPANLTDTEAAARLIKFGPNSLPQEKKENFLIHILKLIREPMLLLLIATAGIYLVMGDLGEGLMLVASAFVVIGISIYQERKSEKALAALKELSSPRALVIRSGLEKRIAAIELVPGDLIALNEGDRIPADGVVISATNLRVDESLLTGESLAVRKQLTKNEITESNYELLDNSNKTFSSTLVVSGTAFVRVMKTGANTEVGKIGKSLQELEPEDLNLSREIRQLVQLFAWSGAMICIAIVIIYGLTHHNWTQAILVGLATQMALLPEEFPVVLTIFLAMGAWRLSKAQILIRKSGSIERLGAITALCVDKTGTLTQNQMTVAALNNGHVSTSIDANSVKALAEDFHTVAEFGVLASQRDPFDPMERAIRKMVERENWGQDHIHKDWAFIRDYPLTDKLFAMSCVWKAPNSNSYIVAAKGAPEAIIELCHLNTIEASQVLEHAKNMAKQGLRVLGVARAEFIATQLPKDQHDFDFKSVGLIGLEDPLRAEAPAAVKMCREAGVRVIMMTGDYPETALKIADRAGIDTVNSLITGAELSTLSDDELTRRLQTAHIFARMIPEQKLRIVKLLKKMGHVVAMTGDGVNDAPSLKWADVGIAMGARGTDVAREASDIVLLDDNFKSIVSGIERGRLIFNNIKKAISYIVSIHVPIAGLSLLPVLLGSPLVLMPVHIVFLELIIDPACSLMFESQESENGLMSTPPRALNSRLFSASDLLRSFLQGLLVLIVVSAVIWYDNQINHAETNHTRSLAFVVLALSNLGLIFANLSGGHPRQIKALFTKTSNQLIVVGLTLCLLLLTQIERVRTLFHFDRLELQEFGISFAIAFVAFGIVCVWNYLTKNKIVA